MGWRWRKRVKVAPGVTLNLSDRNVGVTVGGKAGRVSASSSGRVTVGQSVPGTGLYRSEVIASGKRPGSLPGQPVKRAGGCWRWVLYAVIGLVGLMGCGLVGSLVSPARPAPLSDRVVPTWTSTPAPAATETPMPTETPLPVPTVEERAAPVLVLPTATATPAGPPCECGSDLYRCDSFVSQPEAQACFEYCVALGAGDVHGLDGNNDGFVCED